MKLSHSEVHRKIPFCCKETKYLLFIKGFVKSTLCFRSVLLKDTHMRSVDRNLKCSHSQQPTDCNLIKYFNSYLKSYGHERV